MKHHGRTQFSGVIRFVSCSPHGDPEGVVLHDGSFVKVPPHSLHRKDLFQIGTEVEGSGEVIATSPNRVYHHARIQNGNELLADDSVEKNDRERLKEKHKREIHEREEAPEVRTRIAGRLIAIGTKPKGEVDRLILEDGTSVHVPKDIELWADDVQLGKMMEVAGKARDYDRMRFLKAESVRMLGGA